MKPVTDRLKPNAESDNFNFVENLSKFFSRHKYFLILTTIDPQHSDLNGHSSSPSYFVFLVLVALALPCASSVFSFLFSEANVDNIERSASYG